MDIPTIVTQVVTAATELLGQLPALFASVFEIFFDSNTQDPTTLGMVLIATAGFALAWAGIRLVLGYIGKLLNATRGGRR